MGGVTQFPDPLQSYVICTSTTRPSSPFDGQMIYETNTFKTLIYYAGKSAWLPPWDTAWGILRWQQETVDYGPTALSGNSDLLLTDVEARADRTYEVTLNCNFVLSATALWDIYLSVDGTRVARFGVFDKAYTLGNSRNGTLLWQPATTGAYDLRVSHQEFSGSASLTYTADANNPRAFWVADVGPRV